MGAADSKGTPSGISAQPEAQAIMRSELPPPTCIQVWTSAQPPGKPAWQLAQRPQPFWCQKTPTRSPIRRSVTPAPSSTISPAGSCPATNGGFAERHRGGRGGRCRTGQPPSRGALLVPSRCTSGSSRISQGLLKAVTTAARIVSSISRRGDGKLRPEGGACAFYLPTSKGRSQQPAGTITDDDIEIESAWVSNRNLVSYLLTICRSRRTRPASALPMRCSASSE